MIPLRKKNPAPAPVRRLDVIVADDVEDIQRLVTFWLEEAGHRVDHASDGRELLQRVEKKSYDVVVTDIVMPNGGGWDAILAINRVRPATRILAISGGGKQMSADLCLRMAKGVGADAILRKPFRRAQFLAAVEQITR